jgi:hypothetical protein
MLGYFAALLGGRPYAHHSVGLFIAYVLALTTIFVAICFWKGEAARWRWGKD